MVCNEIFASLHSNAAARCAGCTYKCGFRRKMSNGPTDSAPLYQTLVRACVYAISAALNFSLIRVASRTTDRAAARLCIVTVSLSQNCPHIFNGPPSRWLFRCFLRIVEREKVSRCVIWTYENNNRRPRGANFRDNWPFSFSHRREWKLERVRKLDGVPGVKSI